MHKQAWSYYYYDLILIDQDIFRPPETCKKTFLSNVATTALIQNMKAVTCLYKQIVVLDCLLILAQPSIYEPQDSPLLQKH